MGADCLMMDRTKLLHLSSLICFCVKLQLAHINKQNDQFGKVSRVSWYLIRWTLSRP